MTISQQLKNLSINGCISLDNAMKLAKVLDTQRDTAITLLKQAERNCGMHLGEQINVHLAAVEGTYFNPEEYNFESMPSNQRV